MEQLIIAIALTAALVTHIIVVYKREHRYQQTIDRMTDKLMARDYKEYVAMQPKHEQPERKTKKPLSWYDDADIEEDDVAN